MKQEYFIFDLTNYSEKLRQLVWGIIMAEGWAPAGTNGAPTGGSRSYRNHNPGNIEHWETEVGRDGVQAIFSDDMAGFSALHQYLINAANGNNTAYDTCIDIADMLKVYTGLQEGDELANYRARVVEYSKLDLKTDLRLIL